MNTKVILVDIGTHSLLSQFLLFKVDEYITYLERDEYNEHLPYAPVLYRDHTIKLAFEELVKVDKHNNYYYDNNKIYEYYGYNP